jgi:CO/xanthine dehydrogenase FAD-binding subunit
MSATSAFSCPESFARLFELLAEPNAVVLGGGTALVGQTRRRKRHLLSLKKLGLDFIKFEESTVEIGAMVTITSLINCDSKGHSGLELLQQAAKRLASTFIRNAATVGGSTVACFRWSDLPAALLASDAKMNLSLADGSEKEVSATEFFKKHPARLFRQGAILRSLSIPKREGIGSFFKMSPLTYGYAIWDVAAFKPKEGAGAKVAISAGVSLPRRLSLLEKGLDDGVSDRKEIEELACKDLAQLKIVGSRTVSKEYRTIVAPVILADTIERVLAEKGGINED